MLKQGSFIRVTSLKTMKLPKPLYTKTIHGSSITMSGMQMTPVGRFTPVTYPPKLDIESGAHFIIHNGMLRCNNEV